MLLSLWGCGYCDVIVRRWQNWAGKQAVLEADGGRFSDIDKGTNLAESEL